MLRQFPNMGFLRGFLKNRSLFKTEKLDSCPGVLWGSSSRDQGLLEVEKWGKRWEKWENLQLIQDLPFFTTLA